MAHRSSFVSVLLLGHGHYTGFLLPSSYDSLRCTSHYIYIWPIYRWFTYEKWWFSIHTYIHTYIHIYIYMDGWWLSPTPLKNDGVKVSWDDDIPFPIWWEKIHSCSKPPTSIVNLQIFESWIFRVHSSFWMTSYLTIKSSSPSHWLPRVPHTAAFSMPFLPVGHDPNAARGPVWREKWAGGPTQLMVRRRQKCTADHVW